MQLIKWVALAALSLSSIVVVADPVADAGNWELENAFKGARPVWPLRGFENLPKVWAAQAEGAERDRLAAIPLYSEDFKRELEKRYGMFYEPTSANDRLPYALTKTRAGFTTKLDQDVASGEPGFTFNCRGCHSGAFFSSSGRTGGKLYTDGLSNVFMDIDRFDHDVMEGAGLGVGNLFRKNLPRNSMINAADYFGRLLTYVRRPYPQIDIVTAYQAFYGRYRLPRHRHLENDVQAYLKTQNWVNVGTKFRGTEGTGLYVDGGFFDNPSSIMYGVIFSVDKSGADFLAADEGFRQRGIPYLASLKAPPYPFRDSLDRAAVERGFAVYQHTCQGCHGTYAKAGNGFELQTYPGKIIPVARVGTDPLRANDPGFGSVFNGDSWVRPGAIQETGGYKAPPLHGVWARAPYLHNGSVPNIRQLMNPKLRVARFAIQPRPRDADNYDRKNMGWKITELKNADEIAALKKADPYVRIYDPEAYPYGLSNRGHLFGAKLSDAQIDDLIAFLGNL